MINQTISLSTDVRTGGEESRTCFDAWQRLTNQITALTNQIVELYSRVKTNLRLLPTSTDVYWYLLARMLLCPNWDPLKPQRAVKAARCRIRFWKNVQFSASVPPLPSVSRSCTVDNIRYQDTWNEFWIHHNPYSTWDIFEKSNIQWSLAYKDYCKLKTLLVYQAQVVSVVMYNPTSVVLSKLDIYQEYTFDLFSMFTSLAYSQLTLYKRCNMRPISEIFALAKKL